MVIGSCQFLSNKKAKANLCDQVFLFITQTANHNNRSKPRIKNVIEKQEIMNEIGVKHVIRLMNPKSDVLYLMCIS